MKTSDLPEDLRGCYVIVGRGFCGVLDHVTLRARKWGKERLGDLPVLHIGFEDPWSLYRSHHMGQTRHLLDLPGFAPEIAAGPADGYELSSRFAARVKSEMDRLVASGEAEVMAGWVALIQYRDAPRPDLAEEVGKSVGLNSVQIRPLNKHSSISPPYRLLVMEPDGSPQLVYACKIDLCTSTSAPVAGFLGSGRLPAWETTSSPRTRANHGSRRRPPSAT